MKTMIKCGLFAFLILSFSSVTAFGQIETKTIYLKDGTTIQGKIVAQDDSTLVVDTQYGTLEIQRVNVLKQERAGQFPSKEIKSEVQTINLKDGTSVKGIIVSEDADSLAIMTTYGQMRIPRSAIEKRGGEMVPHPQKVSEGGARGGGGDNSFTVALESGRADTILNGRVIMEFRARYYEDPVLSYKGILGISESPSGEFDQTSVVVFRDQVFYVKVDSSLTYKVEVVEQDGKDIELEFSRPGAPAPGERELIVGGQEVSEELDFANIKIQAERDAKDDEGSAIGYGAGGFFCGIFGWIFATASSPDVPAVRLVGKSPTYVAMYSDTYKDRRKSIRTQSACIGWGIGAAVAVTIYLTTRQHETIQNY